METRDIQQLDGMLCHELKQITNTGKINDTNLERINYLVNTIYKLEKMGESGYSYGNGNWEVNGSYGRGYNNMSMSDRSMNNSYNDSYARNGQHYVRGHYSYDGGNDVVMEHINQMINDPRYSTDDRSILSRAMDVLKR